jgi:hypothetical protein
MRKVRDQHPVASPVIDGALGNTRELCSALSLVAAARNAERIEQRYSVVESAFSAYVSLCHEDLVLRSHVMALYVVMHLTDHNAVISTGVQGYAVGP